MSVAPTRCLSVEPGLGIGISNFGTGIWADSVAAKTSAWKTSRVRIFEFMSEGEVTKDGEGSVDQESSNEIPAVILSGAKNPAGAANRLGGADLQVDSSF